MLDNTRNTNSYMGFEKSNLFKKIIEKIGLASDLESVLNFICREVGILFEVDRVGIGCFDGIEDNVILITEYTFKNNIPLFKKPIFAPDYINFFKSYFIEQGNSMILDNIESSDKPECYKAFHRELGTKAIITIPIIKDNDKWGIITLFSNELRHWTQEEIEFIKELIEYIYIAIKQAELYNKTKKQAERETFLRQISDTIRSTLDSETIIKYFVDETSKFFDVDRCLFFVFDRDANDFKSSHYEVLKSPDIISLAEVDPAKTFPEFVERVRKGKDVIVPDMEKLYFQERLKGHLSIESLYQSGVKSDYGLSIRYMDNYYGILIMHFTSQKKDFTKEEFEFIDIIKNQVAIALHQAEQYKTEKERAEREALIRNIISTIGSTLDIDKIKRSITEAIGKTLNLERCFIIELDQLSNKVLPVNSASEYRSLESVKSVIGFNFNKSDFELFLKANQEQSEIFENKIEEFIEKHQKYINNTILNYFERFDIKAGFQVPLFYGNQNFGFIVGHHEKQRLKYSEEERDFIRTLANQTAIALHQSGLYQKEKKTAKREALIRSIISSIGTNLDINEVKKDFVEIIGRTLGLDRCFIVEYDPIKDSLVPLNEFSEYRSNETVKSLIGFNFDIEIFKQFKELGKVKFEMFADNDLFFKEQFKHYLTEETMSFFYGLNVRSGFQLSIFHQNKYLGILVGQSNHYRNEYTEEEKELIRTIANQAGSAIYQAKLYEKQKQTAAQEALLRNIISTISSNLDQDSIKKNIAQALGKSLKLDRCFINDYDSVADALLPVKESVEYRSSEQTKSVTIHDFSKLRFDFFKDIAKQNQEFFISNYLEFEKKYKHYLNEDILNYFNDINVKSGFQIPLFYGREHFGNIVGHYDREREDYTEEEKEFLRAIAKQTGIALYQARLYSEIKESEQKLILNTSILEELNKSQDTQIIISSICHLIKNYLNVDAIGIRLKQNNEHPYFIAEGYSEELIRLDSNLCFVDTSGQIQLDSSGNPILQCICGAILSQKLDYDLSFVTPYGSFWTNNLSQLIPDLIDKELISVLRNRCGRSDYECLVLIPLRYEDEIIGLLQLNNKETNIFTLETIQFFEKIALTIGIALKRRSLEESLAEEKNALERNVEERTWALRDSLIELNKKQNILDGINSILRETILCESIEEVCNVSLTVAEKLTGCNLGLIIKKNDQGTLDVIRLSDTGWSICQMDEHTAIRSLKGLQFRSFWARIISEGKSLIINDPLNHPDSVGLPEGHPPITSFIGVPLVDKGVAFGMIGLANKAGGFTKQDQEILELIAVPFVESLNRKRKDLEIQKQKEALEIINVELDQANKQKSQFLASLSHELRTPLNAVIGFSDLLHEQLYGFLNPNQLNYVQLIKSSGVHLAELIDDLLDITRIDAGKLNLLLEPNLPDILIDEVINNMSNELNTKKLNIQKYYEPMARSMMLDRKRFKQIIINLLSNAIKFTNQGGNIKIYIEIEDNNLLKVSVVDDGIGIPEDKKENIFDEFYQIDSSVTRVTSGLGIGLALTKRLVLLHDGNINVQNAPGQGTMFTFSIPIIYASIQNKADKDHNRFNQLPRNKKILVVEDNVINLKLITDLLSTFDHKLSIAKNGQEAIEMAQSEYPELILMDIKMPVMDGIEAVKILRRMKEFDTIPIVALTAFAGAKAEKDMLEAGFTRHVSKPINFNEIFSVLEEYLGNKTY